MKLQLKRPIIFFDLETTGLNPQTDRIIEICVIKVFPDGGRDSKTRRINPTIPISEESTAVTGIRDEDVKDCPTFKQLAKGLIEFISGCDLSGFNVLRFDLPMLVEEFKRAEIDFNLQNVHIIDVQRIYHKKEPRTLEAALLFYCNETLEGAHAAENDVEATIKVLEGQLTKYDDLGHTVADLAKYCKDDRWADCAGRLHWKGEEVAIGFGKKQGTLLREMVKTDRSYLDWILKGEFPEDTKEIIRNAIEGKYPKKE